MTDNPDKFTVMSEDIWGEGAEKTYRTCSKCCYMGSRDVTTCPMCGKIYCTACLKQHATRCLELHKEENNVKGK